MSAPEKTLADGLDTVPDPLHAPALDDVATATLEAFADTIVPGEKRHPDDHAIAGVTDGPGAVQAGALLLLRAPETGVFPALPQIVAGLNAFAVGVAAATGRTLDPALPPFVALDFDSRTAVVQRLTAPDQPGHDDWSTLALVVSLAFDDASFMSTAQAVRNGHPGITTLGMPLPDSDGLWRYRDYSYGRQLARPHPNTTAKGSPA